MSILIIIPEYIPKINPRVLRWQAIAEYWASKGKKVIVLCGKHKDHPEEENINKVRVIRVGHANLMDWLNYVLKSKRSRREITFSNTENSAKKSNPKILIWLHKIWTFFYWPDGSCLWAFSVKNKLHNYINEFNPKAVISVSLPFSSHLVGKYCKQIWPDVKWVVDIGDPFSILDSFPKNNLLLYRHLNKKIERKIFSIADSVCVTFEGAKRAYGASFPESEEKIYVIPPLLNRKKIIFQPFPIVLEYSKVHLAYFGSFYSGIRPPDPAIELMDNIAALINDFSNNVVLHIFGYIEPEFYKKFQTNIGFNKRIYLHGLCTPEEVTSYIQAFDYLLNIGNRTNIQLPSKCVEYLASGKPIINICLRKDDTFAAFFEEYPLIFNLWYDDNQFEKKQISELLIFLKNVKGRNVGENFINERIKELRVQFIAEKYEKTFT